MSLFLGPWSLYNLFPHSHSLYSNCNSMRNLILQKTKRLFSYYLSRNLSLRLVCKSFFIIKWWSKRKKLFDGIHQFVNILSLERSYFNNFIKIHLLPIGIFKFIQIVLGDSIYLIDYKDHRFSALFEFLNDRLLTGSNESAGLYQPQNHVNLFKSTLGHLGHIFAKLILGVVYTRCIQKNHLTFIISIDCHDLISGGLGLIGCNSNLLPYHMVHKCRFTHIWAAYQSDKTCLKIILHFILSSIALNIVACFICNDLLLFL